MNGSTLTKTNGLQEYFVLFYANTYTGKRHERLQWPIQYQDDHCSRTIFTDEGCFAIPLVDGHEIQELKSNE